MKRFIALFMIMLIVFSSVGVVGVPEKFDVNDWYSWLQYPEDAAMQVKSEHLKSCIKEENEAVCYGAVHAVLDKLTQKDLKFRLFNEYLKTLEGTDKKIHKGTENAIKNDLLQELKKKTPLPMTQETAKKYLYQKAKSETIRDCLDVSYEYLITKVNENKKIKKLEGDDIKIAQKYLVVLGEIPKPEKEADEKDKNNLEIAEYYFRGVTDVDKDFKVTFEKVKVNKEGNFAYKVDEEEKWLTKDVVTKLKEDLNVVGVKIDWEWKLILDFKPKDKEAFSLKMDGDFDIEVPWLRKSKLKFKGKLHDSNFALDTKGEEIIISSKGIETPEGKKVDLTFGGTVLDLEGGKISLDARGITEIKGESIKDRDSGMEYSSNVIAKMEEDKLIIESEQLKPPGALKGSIYTAKRIRAEIFNQNTEISMKDPTFKEAYWKGKPATLTPTKVSAFQYFQKYPLAVREPDLGGPGSLKLSYTGKDLNYMDLKNLKFESENLAVSRYNEESPADIHYKLVPSIDLGYKEPVGGTQAQLLNVHGKASLSYTTANGEKESIESRGFAFRRQTNVNIPDDEEKMFGRKDFLEKANNLGKSVDDKGMVSRDYSSLFISPTKICGSGKAIQVVRHMGWKTDAKFTLLNNHQADSTLMYIEDNSPEDKSAVPKITVISDSSLSEADVVEYSFTSLPGATGYWEKIGTGIETGWNFVRERMGWSPTALPKEGSASIKITNKNRLPGREGSPSVEFVSIDQYDTSKSKVYEIANKDVSERPIDFNAYPWAEEKFKLYPTDKPLEKEGAVKETGAIEGEKVMARTQPSQTAVPWTYDKVLKAWAEKKRLTNEDVELIKKYYPSMDKKAFNKFTKRYEAWKKEPTEPLTPTISQKDIRKGKKAGLENPGDIRQKIKEEKTHLQQEITKKPEPHDVRVAKREKWLKYLFYAAFAWIIYDKLIKKKKAAPPAQQPAIQKQADEWKQVADETQSEADKLKKDLANTTDKFRVPRSKITALQEYFPNLKGQTIRTASFNKQTMMLIVAILKRGKELRQGIKLNNKQFEDLKKKGILVPS